MLELVGIPLEALSVGGLETCIGFPAWGVLVDVGRCPPWAIRYPRVFLTHAHLDHAGAIAYHCAMRDLQRLSPPTYYVPRDNLQDFQALFEVWRRLDRSSLPCTWVPLHPGERAPLGAGLWVEPFRSPHRVFCQGYAFSREKKKRKAALAGVPELELRARRLAGEEITDTVWTVEAACTGDAMIEVVDREECVRTARLLVMEATFLDERVSVAQARSKGHIHLDEIIARAEQLQNEKILLMHVSSRYTNAQLQAILDERLPASLRTRVVPLLLPQ